MGNCRTDVFVSVFCDARDSMDSQHNGEGHRNSAVSLYFLEITHFILVEEQNVFKNNVRDIYSASPTLCAFMVVKISYVEIYTMFPGLSMHIFDFFHFFTISWQSGFPVVFAC